MALVLADRVQVTTSTTGTGTLTLGAAVTGFQDFSVIGDGNTTYYTIVNSSEWEVGIGTYSTSGDTLTRDTILKSSSGSSAINLSGGSNVFVTYPAGRAVDTETAQTLTNKTIDIASNTLTGVQPTLVSGTNIKTVNSTSLLGSGDVAVGDVTLTGTQTLTNKTVEKIILNDGYTEEVFAITDGASVNLDPNNGSIQTWTLGANRTPDQANWAAGQSITLMIDDGSAFTITWTTLDVVWKTDGGTAPTLNTTGFTVIALWKVGTTIYGARVGDA